MTGHLLVIDSFPPALFALLSRAAYYALAVTHSLLWSRAIYGTLVLATCGSAGLLPVFRLLLPTFLLGRSTFPPVFATWSVYRLFLILSVLLAFRSALSLDRSIILSLVLLTQLVYRDASRADGVFREGATVGILSVLISYPSDLYR